MMIMDIFGTLRIILWHSSHHLVVEHILQHANVSKSEFFLTHLWVSLINVRLLDIFCVYVEGPPPPA